MRNFGAPVRRQLLLATVAGAICTSAVHAQIGVGGTKLMDPVTPPTIDVGHSDRPPRLYGTANLSSHTVQAFAFQPLHESDAGVAGSAYGSRYCTVVNCYLEAPLLLPAGALIEGIELEACDTSTSGYASVRLNRFGALESSGTELVEGNSGISATPGCDFFFFELPAFETVDNRNNSYVVEMRLTNTAEDDTVRFHAARVFYRLQVSPPPGSATFGDVPTDHPFFPFVEALVDAGITSGCGSDNYCPDAPLTRGQMAVFLVKALGLHWAP